MGNKPTECIFCTLSTDTTKVLNEDQRYFAFHDIAKGSAREHILVCTKQHIVNALHLDSPERMREMKEFGRQTLLAICQQKGVQDPQFRFGFHLPPYNSVHHVHLHCFLEPFSNPFKGSFHYGYMLYSLEATEQKWREQQGKL